MPLSWDSKTEFNENDKKFAKVLRFFVIESPVENVSKRGISFKQHGWNITSLNSKLKKEIPSLKTNWITTSVKDIDSVLKEHNIFHTFTCGKEIFIHTDNKSSKTKSLYYAIRCSFAHGDFSIHKYKNEKFYALQNQDNGKIKARIIVREKTLLKIINISKNNANQKSSKKKV